MASPYALALAVGHRYRPAKHLKFISDHVVRAFDGSGPSILLIEAPPRHGKSDLLSWYTPAWVLLNAPNARIMHSSYSGNISKRFGGLTRDTYRVLGKGFNGFGLSYEINSRGNWQTQAGGGMTCIGRGGAMTSLGANLMIIDDPIRNAQEALSSRIREGMRDWWSSTVLTRLEPGAVVIVTHTRWHREDLIGEILKNSAEDAGLSICRISLPALAVRDDILGRKEGEPLWPEVWPVARLKQQEGTMSRYWWKALYQQDASNPEGTEFPLEWFDDIFCEEHEWPTKFDLTAMAMDPSEGKEHGDYQGIVWGGLAQGRVWVDADIERRPIDGACNAIIDLAVELGCDGILLEANSFQRLIEQPLQEECRERKLPPLPVYPISSLTKKELRIQRLAPYLRKGLLKFRRPKEPNTGTALLRDQLIDFPHGDHDDGPDALEMMMRMLNYLRLGDGLSDSPTNLRA